MAKTAQDVLPTVALRVPGPWTDVEQLAGRLPAGVRIRKDWLIMPTGQHLLLDVMPADREFPTVFRMSCKQPLEVDDLEQLERYAANAVLVGGGGSRVAGAALLRAGTALLKAGGHGVFVDNSLASHRPCDWLELNENWQDPDALCYAFIGLVRLENEVFSHGMHALGFRDGVIEAGDDPQQSAASLDMFLRQLCRDGRARVEGDLFCDDNGRTFHLAREDCPVFVENHPTNNPYGRWRLVPGKT